MAVEVRAEERRRENESGAAALSRPDPPARSGAAPRAGSHRTRAPAPVPMAVGPRSGGPARAARRLPPRGGRTRRGRSLRRDRAPGRRCARRVARSWRRLLEGAAPHRATPGSTRLPSRHRRPCSTDRTAERERPFARSPRGGSRCAGRAGAATAGHGLARGAALTPRAPGSRAGAALPARPAEAIASAASRPRRRGGRCGGRRLPAAAPG